MITKTPLRFYSPQYDSRSYDFRHCSVRWPIKGSFFCQQYLGWHPAWVSTLNARHEWAILKCCSEEQSKMMCNSSLQGRQVHKFCRPPKSEQALYTWKYNTFKYTNRSNCMKFEFYGREKELGLLDQHSCQGWSVRLSITYGQCGSLLPTLRLYSTFCRSLSSVIWLIWAVSEQFSLGWQLSTWVRLAIHIQITRNQPSLMSHTFFLRDSLSP